jgi:hypothetical protein
MPGSPSRRDPRDLPAAGVLASLRTAALAATGGLITVATLVSFGESYRGLLDWASRHGLSGAWAILWPLQVDVFIATGELSLFIALVDQWSARSRILPWAVTCGGLAVSVAANVGHVPGHSLASHATAAVPPLAASAALSVGLGVLKRVVRASGSPRPARAAAPATRRGPRHAAAPAALPLRLHAAAPPATAATAAAAGRPADGPGIEEVERHFRDQLAAGALPTLRAIRDQWHVGSKRATALRSELAARHPSARGPAAPKTASVRRAAS